MSRPLSFVRNFPYTIRTKEGEASIPAGRKRWTHKTCRECGETKPQTAEFFYRKGGKFQHLCKPCYRNMQNERRDANRGSVNEYQRAWREANPEKFPAYDRAYRERNEDVLRARRRTREFLDKKAAYAKKVRDERPEYRIRNSLNKQICKVANSAAYRGYGFEERFGYKPSDLRDHLEQQFTPEMSWDNYGTYWEIDHKRPVTSFNFDGSNVSEVIKECWALSNLRPLEVTANRRKYNKIIPGLIATALHN